MTIYVTQPPAKVQNLADIVTESPEQGDIVHIIIRLSESHESHSRTVTKVIPGRGYPGHPVVCPAQKGFYEFMLKFVGL